LGAGRKGELFLEVRKRKGKRPNDAASRPWRKGLKDMGAAERRIITPLIATENEASTADQCRSGSASAREVTGGENDTLSGDAGEIEEDSQCNHIEVAVDVSSRKIFEIIIQKDIPDISGQNHGVKCEFHATAEMPAEFRHGFILDSERGIQLFGIIERGMEPPSSNRSIDEWEGIKESGRHNRPVPEGHLAIREIFLPVINRSFSAESRRKFCAKRRAAHEIPVVGVIRLLIAGRRADENTLSAGVHDAQCKQHGST